MTRSDGTATGWDFPTYGDGLPHDLCHLVVEDELGISDGFWGLVDRGVDVGLVDNQATLISKGQPLVQQPGADITGLIYAEEVVAALTGVGTTFRGEPCDQAGIDRQAAARLRRRLVALQGDWVRLADGGSLTLYFPCP